MDNDNKIALAEEQRHKDVLLFLQDELEPLKIRNQGQSYNLEEEYAKTKKNRSPFVPLVLTGCILIIMLVSFLLTRSISKTNRDIKVNVSEFNDVNLKNLIDTVSRTQEQYEAAVKNKIQIETQKKVKLNEALDKRDGDLVTIKSLNIRDKKLRERREEEVQQAYEAAVKEINSEFSPLIEAAQMEADTFKEKLDEYDNQKIEAAQEQQKALDSQRQLQELERKRLTEQYEKRIQNLETTIETNRSKHNTELRRSLTQVSEKLQAEIDALDPVIEDEKAVGIVSAAGNNDRMISDPENNAAFGAGNISDADLKEQMAEIKKMYSDYRYLDQKVIDLPHKNQIGQYTETNAKLVAKVTDALADSVYDQYKAKVSIVHEMEQMKKDYEAQIKKLEESKYDILYESMQGAGFSSIIAEKPVSKDEIYLYVRPNARFLVGDEGCEAEIPFKKPIKGRVVRTADDRFRFDPEKKNGEYVDFDLSALVTGVQVKLK